MKKHALHDARNPLLLSGRTALIYLGFSIVWILLGDQLLFNLYSDPADLTYWQMIKGGMFVLLSASLIFFLMQQSLRALQREKEQVQRLVYLTRHSPVVTITWRHAPGWPVVFVSENISQWNYRHEEFLSGAITYEDLIHPEDRPRILAEVNAHLERGSESYRQEYRFRHGDGHWIWLEDRSWRVRNSAADEIEIHGVLIDISEEKLLREIMHAHEAHYRQLFEANPHPMWVYDLETLAFLTVNDAAVAKYGYSRKEFLGMTIKDIRPQQDIPPLLQNIEKVANGLDEAGVWRHITKQGHLLDVEITSHALLFEGRRAELVLAHDVTERLRSDTALRERNAELEQFTNASIDRELRMTELKREINSLCRQLDRPPPYDLAFAEDVPEGNQR